MPIEKKHQLNLWYVLAAMLGVLLLQSLFVETQRVETIPYSIFLEQLEADNVARAEIGETRIRGAFRTPHKGYEYFAVTRVEDPTLIERLNAAGVEYAGLVERTFLRDLLSWVLPVLFFLGIWMFIFRRFADKQGFGGLMSVGRSKAKIYVETDTRVTFEDVAGVDEAKAELAGNCRVSQEPGRVQPARRAHPKRHPAGRSAWNRQDTDGPGRRRRGRA